LTKVYTENKIPVNKRNIPTQTDVNKWPHLQESQEKEINADVELLIGVNAPKAMEPWKIEMSRRAAAVSMEAQGVGPDGAGPHGCRSWW